MDAQWWIPIFIRILIRLRKSKGMYVAKFVENDYLSNSSVTDLINDLARVCNKEEPLIKVQNCTQTYLYSQPTLPHPKQL